MQEDNHTEFKSSFSDSVIESLVAFANAKGGKIIIGIDDKGVPVKGFTIGAESIQKWINEVKNKTQPSIIPDAELVEIAGAKVLEFSVREFPIKPVSFKGRYFKRVKNSNHQLSLAEISDLHLKSFNSSWDSYVNPEYTLDSLSLDKVIGFIAMCNKDREIPIVDDPLTVLTKFELIKATGVTNACYLLFSNTDVFSATIELGRFDTATSIKDSLSIRSDLFTEVEDILNFIRKHINKSYIISGDPQREERWQYPIPAIREIAINMVVHRDYTHYGDSSVKIYNDRIEFFNPGKLPEDISIAKLLSGRYISQARNKKIAATFKEAQLIEKYGSGIKRIQEGFIEYGLKAPLFENLQHGFQVTVYSSPESTSEKMSEKMSEKASERILLLIGHNPSVTIAELAASIGISNRSIERNLRKLQKEGKLKRIGPDKGGYWQIL